MALVHDYLREYGGAERVLEALHKLFPDAPVYVAFEDKQALGVHASRFAGWTIRQSWMTRIPGYKRFFSPLRLLAPQFFAQLDFSKFDLVISSTNAYFAKAVHVPASAVHICYCHTPARSLYGYSTMTNWRQNPVFHFFGSLINHYLRVVDVKVAQDVEQFVANSQETARRIEKFYRRSSIVIPPPVPMLANWGEVSALRMAAASHETPYFLFVNRLAYAKHPELAIQACNQLKLPLKVVGSGGMLPELKQMAGPTVTFCGAVSDSELAQLYAGASALLYPVEDEDFGMVPIEALSYGVPVLAHRSGGPKETLTQGETALFFDELTVNGLVGAIQRFMQQKDNFDPHHLWQEAQRYSQTAFSQKFQALIEQMIKGRKKTGKATQAELQQTLQHTGIEVR